VCIFVCSLHSTRVVRLGPTRALTSPNAMFPAPMNPKPVLCKQGVVGSSPIISTTLNWVLSGASAGGGRAEAVWSEFVAVGVSEQPDYLHSRV